MPLTPADVHNVAYSKPPIGKRGYNEYEVDAFIDLVEDTLKLLYTKVDRLSGRIVDLESERVVAAPPVVPAPAASPSGGGNNTNFDDLFSGEDD
jgi:DivIVA domain-containing protein